MVSQERVCSTGLVYLSIKNVRKITVLFQFFQSVCLKRYLGYKNGTGKVIFDLDIANCDCYVKCVLQSCFLYTARNSGLSRQGRDTHFTGISMFLVILFFFLTF